MSDKIELIKSTHIRDLQYRLNTEHNHHPCPNIENYTKDEKLDAVFPISIDVTNFDKIRSAYKYLPLLYQHKMNTLDEKRSRKKHLENTTNYFEQKRIIALSDTPTSDRIISCAFGKKSSCGKDRLCHTCASLNTERIQASWLPRYARADWSHLTLSYDEYVGSGATSFNQWYLHWEAIAHGLKQACKTALIPGAMWREELAIVAVVEDDTPRFLVKPHVHAIIPLKSLEGETLSTIVRWIRGYRFGDQAQEISMTPNLAQTPITDLKEYAAKLRYLRKPFDLVTPYKSAINLGSRNQIFFVRLNRQARELVEAITEGLMNRIMIKSAGNMHPTSAVSLRAVAAA